MEVRNHLYDPKEYNGHPLDLPYPDCPCRPCFHPYRFTFRLFGKEYETWDCLTRAEKIALLPLCNLSMFFIHLSDF